MPLDADSVVALYVADAAARRVAAKAGESDCRCEPLRPLSCIKAIEPNHCCREITSPQEKKSILRQALWPLLGRSQPPGLGAPSPSGWPRPLRPGSSSILRLLLLGLFVLVAALWLRWWLVAAVAV